MLIYDVEIAKAVQGKGETRLDGVQYCKGWTDYAGMGVACVCAYDVNEARYRVFMQDNLLAFGDLARSHDWVLGFNSIAFDDKVMRAAGVEWPAEKSMDLARLIWKAAGFVEGEHPKGWGLDALCKANGLGGKSGNGLMAPVMFQRGDIGGLIDYCLADVALTLKLYRLVAWSGGLRNPVTGEFLPVVVAR